MYALLSRVLKSCAVPLCAAQDVSHPFIQGTHTVRTPARKSLSSHLSYQINCLWNHSSSVQVTLFFLN